MDTTHTSRYDGYLMNTSGGSSNEGFLDMGSDYDAGHISSNEGMEAIHTSISDGYDMNMSGGAWSEGFMSWIASF